MLLLPLLPLLRLMPCAIVRALAGPSTDRADCTHCGIPQALDRLDAHERMCPSRVRATTSEVA
jgi:hypothetical protein